MNRQDLYATLVPYVGDGFTGYMVVVKRADGCWQDGGQCGCCADETVKHGPYLGDALLPADVQAARWARERGIPYRG
jgi:hypothetical protein